jgi:hypothetical protein
MLNTRLCRLGLTIGIAALSCSVAYAAHEVDPKDVSSRARAPVTTSPRTAQPKPVAIKSRTLQSIDYEKLGDKIGRDIIVHTSNGTRREGTLLKYSGASLEMKLIGKDGGITLDVPRKQAVSIDLVTENISSVEGDRAKTK